MNDHRAIIVLCLSLATIPGCDRPTPNGSHAPRASQKYPQAQRHSEGIHKHAQSTEKPEDNQTPDVVIDDPTDSAVWTTARNILKIANNYLDQGASQ